MRREISFWLLIILLCSALLSLAYTVRAEETYDNAKVYRLLYESGTTTYFSTNVPERGKIPAFVQRGEMQCGDGIQEESITTGGAIVTTCIEVIPAHRGPVSVMGVTA